MMTKLNFNWLACFVGLLVPLTSQTAPGTVAQAPLFSATSSGGGVPSNIFFQIDDSGSMDWAVGTKKYFTACNYDPQNPGLVAGKTCTPTTLQVNGEFNTYINDSSPSFTGVSDITEFVTGSSTTADNISTDMLYDWRIRAAAMNALYYNPDITYEPWKVGDGSKCSNASFTAAKNSPTPFDCGAAATQTTVTTRNLTGFLFEVARDTHGYTGTKPSLTTGGTSVSRKVGTVTTTTIDQAINRSVGANQRVDFWDEHTSYKVNASDITQTEVTYAPTKSATPSSTTTTGAGTNKVTITNKYTQNLNPTATVTTLTTGLNGRTLTAEKQNIANWYQYYRQRINVAKSSVAQVIDSSPNYRYGLNTIWNRDFVEVITKTGTVTDDAITHNKALLAKLFKRTPSSGTPLPDALNRVGQYYKHQALPSLNSTTGTGVTYADPIAYECQQNFAILQTDGYWNDDLDSTIQALIGDKDGDGVGATHSTLADVARYYYDIDLNTSLVDSVPTNTFDNNARQHMVTYTVAFGLDGNLVKGADGWPTPSLTESGDNKDTSAIETGLWGTAVNGGLNDNIDDLWHAAYNGRGLYVSASSPEDIAAGFASIFENIAKRDYKGSASSASFNTSTTSGSNSAYLSRFSLIDNIWSGDIIAYNVSSSGRILNADGTTPTSSSLVTPKWKAATELDALVNPVSSRHIFTYNRHYSPNAGTLATAKGVPFQWTYLTDSTTPTNPVVSEAQKDLGTSTSGAITVGTPTVGDPAALARLAYLRGDTSNDGVGTYQFRKRAFTSAGVTHKNLLGDIIHSTPVLVAAPPANWPARAPFLAAGTSYKTFKTAINATNGGNGRTPVVYAGANDGMLHGFYAADGSEAMAYIPETLFSSANSITGLHYLTSPSYPHRYYVDMPSVVEDAIITKPGFSAEWRTVLIGGYMAGGRGIFALDITDPSLFSTEDVTNAAKIALWEFNSNDDADMGYSFSIPTIAMMSNGKWAAVFGNGYNSTNTTGNLGSNGGTPNSYGKEKDIRGNYTAGKATLFIVFLDGGLDGTWTYGTDYIKITAPDSTDPTVTVVNGAVTTSIDCSTASCNGLSTPQLEDINLDRKIDRAYAGDLKGNMWAFDLSNSNPSNWGVAYPSATGGAAPKPLFTATYHKSANPFPTTAGGTDGGQSPLQQNTIRQPITSRPVLLRNLKARGTPNLLVLFGTGQYLTLADTSSTDMQSYYAVWDHGIYGLTPANLIQQSYLSDAFTNSSGANIATGTIRVMTKNAVTYTTTSTVSAANASTTNQGWFINLVKDAANPTVSVGERQIVDSDILDSKYLFFNTWIPGPKTATATNSCTTQGNSSGSGFLMSVDVYTGGEANKVLFDLSGNSALDAADKATNATGAHSVGGRVYSTGLPGSSSFIKGIQYTPGTDTESDLNPTVVPPSIEDGFRRRSWQELRKD